MAPQSRANTSKVDVHRLAGLLGLWHERSGPLKESLAAALATHIDGGVLRDGDVLPPDRHLSAALGVSRGTVVNAYEALRERGKVARRQGSGTVVTSSAAVADDVELLSPRLFPAPSSSISLLKACPTIRPRIAALIADVGLSRLGTEVDDVEPAGLRVTRTRIAELLTADGVATSPDQVVVTAGAQQALFLTTSLLVRAGDVVITESTTWPGVIDAVALCGGRVVGVEMDDDGIVPTALEAALERLRPAFIAVNPHHHNPTGSRLSEQRREAVAELAAAYHVPLIEDRVTARLAFDGVVPPPLAAYRAGDLDVTIDSVCKSVWPGVRVGWLRANAPMIEQLRQRRAIVDLSGSITDQAIALAVIDRLDELVADQTAELDARSTTLVDSIRALLPDWTIRRPRGGIVTSAELPNGSAEAFCDHAGRFGVQVASGRQFTPGVFDNRHVRLPFTADEAVLRTAVERLAAAWATFEPHHVAPPLPAIVAG